MPIKVLSAGSLSSVTVATMSDINSGQPGTKGDKGDPGPTGPQGPAGPSYTLPAATVTVPGGVKKAAAQADLATGADAAAIVTGVNALLVKLRAAGTLAE